MIPHRMLTSEICGSGLKSRVIACRKRLRVNRATHKAGMNDDAEELFPETAPSVSEFEDYGAGSLPECPAISTSVVHLDSRSLLPGAELGAREPTLLVAEQEVGIT